MESPNTPPSNETPKPPAPTGAPVAMPAPKPASAPASAAAPVKHKLNHSYVWLGALRIVPFVFVVAIASAGDALSRIDRHLYNGWFHPYRIASIDRYRSCGHRHRDAGAIHQLQLHLVRVFQRRIQLLFGHHLEETRSRSLSAHPIDQSESNAVPAHCGSLHREHRNSRWSIEHCDHASLY